MGVSNLGCHLFASLKKTIMLVENILLNLQDNLNWTYYTNSFEGDKLISKFDKVYKTCNLMASFFGLLVCLCPITCFYNVFPCLIQGWHKYIHGESTKINQNVTFVLGKFSKKNKKKFMIMIIALLGPKTNFVLI